MITVGVHLRKWLGRQDHDKFTHGLAFNKTIARHVRWNVGCFRKGRIKIQYLLDAIATIGDSGRFRSVFHRRSRREGCTKILAEQERIVHLWQNGGLTRGETFRKGLGSVFGLITFGKEFFVTMKGFILVRIFERVLQVIVHGVKASANVIFIQFMPTRRVAGTTNGNGSKATSIKAPFR